MFCIVYVIYYTITREDFEFGTSTVFAILNPVMCLLAEMNYLISGIFLLDYFVILQVTRTLP